MGLDDPGPGSSVFQARFLPSPQETGRFLSLDIPRPPGPRKPSQSSPRASMALVDTQPAIKKRSVNRFMIPPSLGWQVAVVNPVLIFRGIGREGKLFQRSRTNTVGWRSQLACSGIFINPYFFIFLYRVTRLMPRESAARA